MGAESESSRRDRRQPREGPKTDLARLAQTGKPPALNGEWYNRLDAVDQVDGITGAMIAQTDLTRARADLERARADAARARAAEREADEAIQRERNAQVRREQPGLLARIFGPKDEPRSGSQEVARRERGAHARYVGSNPHPDEPADRLFTYPSAPGQDVARRRPSEPPATRQGPAQPPVVNIGKVIVNGDNNTVNYYDIHETRFVVRRDATIQNYRMQWLAEGGKGSFVDWLHKHGHPIK